MTNKQRMAAAQSCAAKSHAARRRWNRTGDVFWLNQAYSWGSSMAFWLRMLA